MPRDDIALPVSPGVHEIKEKNRTTHHSSFRVPSRGYTLKQNENDSSFFLFVNTFFLIRPEVSPLLVCLSRKKCSSSSILDGLNLGIQVEKIGPNNPRRLLVLTLYRH